MVEFAKPPTRGSLKSRIDAAGITDGVMVQLEEGATLQTIVDLCADHGITTTPASVLALKRSHLPDWQAQRVMADAAAEGIPAQCLPDAVRGILLAKIGHFAVRRKLTTEQGGGRDGIGEAVLAELVVRSVDPAIGHEEYVSCRTCGENGNLSESAGRLPSRPTIPGKWDGPSALLR